MAHQRTSPFGGLGRRSGGEPLDPSPKKDVEAGQKETPPHFVILGKRVLNVRKVLPSRRKTNAILKRIFAPGERTWKKKG